MPGDTRALRESEKPYAAFFLIKIGLLRAKNRASYPENFEDAKP
jgi:hypothetical protein